MDLNHTAARSVFGKLKTGVLMNSNTNFDWYSVAI